MSNVVPGNAIFPTVGNTNFIIPKFNRLIVECWGGGYAKKTFAPGQLTVGSTATATVGAGGYSSIGGFGGQGLVLITWD